MGGSIEVFSHEAVLVQVRLGPDGCSMTITDNQDELAPYRRELKVGDGGCVSLLVKGLICVTELRPESTPTKEG